MNRITNIVIVGLILLVAASWIADSKSPSSRLPDEKTYSEFNELIVNGSVDDVILNEEELKIYGTDRSGKQIWATMSRLDDKLVDTLIDRGINFKVIQPEKPSALASFLVSILPFVLFIGVWIYLMRQMHGGAGKGAMSFGKSKARLLLSLIHI